MHHHRRSRSLDSLTCRPPNIAAQIRSCDQAKAIASKFASYLQTHRLLLPAMNRNRPLVWENQCFGIALCAGRTIPAPDDCLDTLLASAFVPLRGKTKEATQFPIR